MDNLGISGGCSHRVIPSAPSSDGASSASSPSSSNDGAPTRYDKLAANFLGFLKLVSIMLWLK